MHPPMQVPGSILYGASMLETAIKECVELRCSLIKRASSTEDAIAIATAFALEATKIYKQLGGDRLVAAQFYGIADSFVK